jgi:hypothetical protein
MWEHYRKTLIPIQILIVGICIVLHLKFAVPIAALVVFILIMEIFSIVGSLWALRLRRKIERARGLRLSRR